jgi:hypothetical protein
LDNAVEVPQMEHSGGANPADNALFGGHLGLYIQACSGCQCVGAIHELPYILCPRMKFLMDFAKARS